MGSSAEVLAERVAAAGVRCSLTKSLLADWGVRGTPRQVEYLAEYLEAECASRDASRKASLLRRCALPQAMALTLSLESLDTPIFSATRCTLRVLVPVAYISATAATRARSTRRWRSITSSGKKLPERSLGIRSVSVPTQVASALSR